MFKVLRVTVVEASRHLRFRAAQACLNWDGTLAQRASAASRRARRAPHATALRCSAGVGCRFYSFSHFATNYSTADWRFTSDRLQSRAARFARFSLSCGYV